MPETTPLAVRYRAFAEQQAAGSSPTFVAWAHAVADAPDLQAVLATLPPGKQQPNLVFAAARLHGATPGDESSLRHTLTHGWSGVRATVLARSTQTNEAARCAALLLGMQRVRGPVALLEVGAAAGLCLVPDRYSYAFSDGSRLDPADGPSPLTIPVTLHGRATGPARMPEIVWRAGLDLDPLDPADPADVAWLDALVWPEHEERRHRRAAAAAITARERVDLRRGDLLHDLDPLVSDAPADATLVVTHSATLAYLDDAARRRAVTTLSATGARRLSLEGRGVDPTVPATTHPLSPRTLFVAALDGVPYALTDGHGSHLTAPCT